MLFIKKYQKVVISCFVALLLIALALVGTVSDAHAASLRTPKITSVSNNTSGIYIKWSKVPSATKYNVYKKTTGDYKRIAI